MPECCHPPSTPASALPLSGSQTGAPSPDAALPWLRLGLAIAIAGISMSLGIGINLDPAPAGARAIVHALLAAGAVAVFLLAGMETARSAVREILAGRITVDLMFLLGMTGAFAASLHSSFTGAGDVYYEVVAILVSIRFLGNLLVARSRSRAGDAVRNMAESLARCRRRSCCGTEEIVAITDILPGDRTVVKPGEAIPVDGIVREGEGYVENATHTGEPFPVATQAGEPVLAGSMSIDGTLLVEASAPGQRREIDELLQRFLERQARPTRREETANRIIRFFLPAVILVSLGTLAFWVGRVPVEVAIFRALAVLLVACPCALGLGLPLTLWRSRHELAKLGITASDPDFLEKLAEADTAVFDKTGTLCSPQLAAGSVDWLTPESKAARGTLRHWIGFIQSRSTHPVARPFYPWASGADELPDLTITVIPGTGIQAVFTAQGRTQELEIGNHRLADDGSPKTPSSRRTLFVKWNGSLAAAIQLEENPFAGTEQALHACTRLGLDTIVMTGDTALPENLREKTKRAFCGLSPDEKRAEIEGLHHQGHRTFFVGDGINDVDALAAAGAGLTVAGAHPLPQAQAQAELHSNRLDAIPAAIVLARRTRTVLNRTLLFALAYNLAGITAAATGFLHPVLAAVIMFTASLTVTTIALRTPLRVHPVQPRHPGQRKTLSASAAPGASAASHVSPVPPRAGPDAAHAG